MTESNLMREIMVALSRAGARIFRNNVALAWVGDATRITKYTVAKVGPGDVVIRNARPLHAGLCDGSSDLIGWMTHEITPEDVGKRVAVFTGVEIKTATGRTSPTQKNFIERLAESGGHAGVARTPEEALALITWGGKAE